LGERCGSLAGAHEVARSMRQAKARTIA
jgi:hypothetical protein